ncbi:MAG: hypothetical protein CJD30_10725 [Sulfuricurvum sp. PD_MW2]|uniref:hypothetical protein n=1 Tax=Sulfuricurvum sp. PD_MW2 TaxID=2027917 RepID=UPI000C05EEBB|nr:hypothetical protein [Sulfuricurvum sp. PD_MW2]PHM16592.1 MAG: hypothetical protein CJD30_10725 [Sulfuricurvum sp. PD_MW2]
MEKIDASDPKLDFENLIEQVAFTHEPIFIRGDNDNTAVLISETMWEGVMMKINSNMHSATLE